jgi:hypothetical protein
MQVCKNIIHYEFAELFVMQITLDPTLDPAKVVAVTISKRSIGACRREDDREYRDHRLHVAMATIYFVAFCISMVKSRPSLQESPRNIIAMSRITK